MGGKHSKIDVFIQKALLKRDILGHELYLESFKKYNPNTDDERRIFQTKFNYALNKLLEKGSIEIIDYEESGSVRQSFKPDFFLFRLVKTDQRDIYQLLSELENTETGKYKTAKKSLLKAFKKKYREHEKTNLLFYESLLSRVNVISAKKERDGQMEELEKEAQELYKSNKSLYEIYLGKVLKSGQEWRFVRDSKDEKKPHPDFIEYHKSLKKTYFYYGSINEKSKVWEITDLTPDEAWTLTKHKYHYKENIAIWEIDEERIKELWRKLGYSRGAWIDKEGTGTPESYLRTFGISDKKMSEDEISEMFNLVLFFISTHENYNVLKHHLAFALSDEKDSMSWFERFIDYIYTEPFTLKFQKDLGIPEPKNIF